MVAAGLWFSPILSRDCSCGEGFAKAEGSMAVMDQMRGDTCHQRDLGSLIWVSKVWLGSEHETQGFG